MVDELASGVIAQFDQKVAPTWAVADALLDAGLDDDARLMRDFGCWVTAETHPVDVWSWLERRHLAIGRLSLREGASPTGHVWEWRTLVPSKAATLGINTVVPPVVAAHHAFGIHVRRWTCWRCGHRSLPPREHPRLSLNHVRPVCDFCFHKIAWKVGRQSVRGDS